MQKFVEVDEPETTVALRSTAAAGLAGPDDDVQFDRMTEEDLLKGLEGSCRRRRSDEEE